ncbi:MAG: hypothetical protein JWR44_2588 [Hymenobacter sp.]|nr:hypothetical protein [Hymenobacter sp.]
MPATAPLRPIPLRLAWQWLVLGAALYSAFFVFYSWPLAREFQTAFVGEAGGDANQYVWNAYNFQRQVAAGANPFYTTQLLYPEGTGLWFHTYTPILGILNVLLRQEILAVNVGLLLSFVLSGVGAARLAGRWLRYPALCLLVGFVFAFSPYKLAHWPGHYHLLLTATVPFYIYSFLEAFAFVPGQLVPPVRRRAALVWCAGLLAVSFLSDYYTLAGVVYFSVGYATWYWLRLGQVSWRRPRPWLVLLAVAVGSHVASRLLGLAGVPDNAGFWWGGDLAGYLVPPIGNRWLASLATNALWHSTRFNTPGSMENVTFLGYVLPGLALVLAALRRRRDAASATATPEEARPLWALALLFFLLTMPVIKLMGHTILRTPTGLVHYVPLLNNIRCPTRYVLLLSLLLPLATFIGLEKWWQQRPAGWRLPIAGLLALLIGLEFQPRPFPLIRTADVPAVYAAAASLPGRALYPIPVGLLDGYRQVGVANPTELFYQTRHHKALPGGYISRISAATFAAFEHNGPVQAALLRAQQPDSAQHAPPTTAQVRAFLQRYQPAAFVVHPDFRNAPVHQLLRQLLQPIGYTERDMGGYVLLQPTVPTSPSR